MQPERRTRRPPTRRSTPADRRRSTGAATPTSVATCPPTARRRSSSPERLVQCDTNGKYDAYMWKDGSCELVSTGHERRTTRRSWTRRADGDDAFFLTRQQLVGIDTDDSVDLYDARVGGGLASQNPPPPPPPCQGDACKPPATPQTGPPPNGTTAVDNPVVPPPPDCSSAEAKAEKKAKQGRQAPKEGRQGLGQAEAQAQEEAEEGQEGGQEGRPASSRPVQPGLISMTKTNDPPRRRPTRRQRCDKRLTQAADHRSAFGIALAVLFALPALAQADLLKYVHRRGPRPKRQPLHPGRRPSVRGLYRHQLLHPRRQRSGGARRERAHGPRRPARGPGRQPPEHAPVHPRAADHGLWRRLSGQHPGRRHGAKDRPRPGLRLGRLQPQAAARAFRRSSASSP